MKKKIKQYIKSGMAIYTLVVFIIVCLFFAFALNVGAKYSTNDWEKIRPAENLYNAIVPFMIWVVIPYIIILVSKGLYCYIKEFIIEPLKENIEGVDR